MVVVVEEKENVKFDGKKSRHQVSKDYLCVSVFMYQRGVVRLCTYLGI